MAIFSPNKAAEAASHASTRSSGLPSAIRRITTKEGNHPDPFLQKQGSSPMQLNAGW